MLTLFCSRIEQTADLRWIEAYWKSYELKIGKNYRIKSIAKIEK
jgi:hypothetical protein